MSSTQQPAQIQPSASSSKKTYTISTLIKKVLAKLKLKPMHKHGFMIIYPLEQHEFAPEPTLPVEIEQVKPEDTQLIEELAVFSVNTSWYKPDNVLQRIGELFQEGDLCFIARHNGQVVCRVWIDIHNPFTVYSSKYPVPLAPDQVYYYDAYTHPDLRGKGIYPYMKLITGRMLIQEYQKRYAVSYIEARNEASLNAQKKLGSVRAHKAGFWRILGRDFYYGWHNPIQTGKK